MYMNIKENKENKENFLQFALNEKETTMDNGRIFKVMQNGVLFIAGGDFNSDILSTYRSNIDILGFVYNGKFYSTHYNAADIDLDFFEELNAFEDKFEADYAEAVKAFSPYDPAPVTDKTKKDTHRIEDFEYYCKHTVYDDAQRELFGISYSRKKTYDHNKFSPIFFDCLKHPENYNGYIQNAIEENANIINYKIRCNAEREKAVEILKSDADMMYKLSMYRALDGISGKTVKMTCSLYGEIFELSIQREDLMRSFWCSGDISLWDFTSTVRENIEQAAIKAGVKKYDAKILFTDIRKITYGRKVIFEQGK